MKAICSINTDFIISLEENALRFVWCEESYEFKVQKKWNLGSMCFCSVSGGD